MTTSVETPKAVADGIVVGACTDGDETKARGAGWRHTLRGGFGLLLGSCYFRVVPVSEQARLFEI